MTTTIMTSGISHIRARLGGLRGLRGVRPRAADRDPLIAPGPVPGSWVSRPSGGRFCRAASRPPGRAARSDGSVWPGYPGSPGCPGPSAFPERPGCPASAA